MIKTRWLVLLGFLYVFLVFFQPVFADPMQPLVTKVYITQDGTPLNDSVDFSLDCFGRVGMDENFFSKHGLKKILNITDGNDAILSYTATCKPHENCYIYSPDIPWMISISFCHLSGTYKGQPFLLKNFSRDRIQYPGLMLMGVGDRHHIYAVSSDSFRQCKDEENIKNRACEKQFKDTKTWNYTPEYFQCQNNSLNEVLVCIRNNGTLMNETEVKGAIRYNELQFDIPSDNKRTETRTSSAVKNSIISKNPESATISPTGQIPQNSSVQILFPNVARSPVESIYCDILRFFGFSC